jgi:hypothetical protein
LFCIGWWDLEPRARRKGSTHIACYISNSYSTSHGSAGRLFASVSMKIFINQLILIIFLYNEGDDYQLSEHPV